MKVSYNWLNGFLNNKLKDAQVVADLLTMNAMEVEAIEKVDDDFLLDVKTLPNNNHSCLCHRGIANEVGVLSDLPILKYSRKYSDFKTGDTKIKLNIKIENEKLCRRYIGRVVEGVKIGKSPDWLKEKLETLGQRSINNLVDATNFVMFELGQPLHVFDADKLAKGGIVNIKVKNASVGDVIKTLDGKDVALDDSSLLITDGKNPLAIAGIKGGTFAEIDENTKNIILESANFNPTNIRKTSQRLKVQTDASKRFENDFLPEIAFEAMEILTALIVEIAGQGSIVVGESVDVYPRRANKYKVGISGDEARAILGIDISDKEIENIFKRFNFEFEKVKPIDKVLSIAESFIGVPYKLGASVSYDAPKAFDCSGYICYLFREAGISIPRVSIDQYVWGEKIEKEDLLPGDTIYSNTGEGKIWYKTFEFLPGTDVKEGVDHCGLYLGDGKVIHTAGITGKVSIEDLSSSERFKNIVGFGRMTNNNERFVVTIPDARIDLRIKEDLAEDIGRVYGYEKIKDISVPMAKDSVIINKNYYYENLIRNVLNDLGFSEVYTYSFVKDGEYELANTIAAEKKFLRVNLSGGLAEALEFNARYSELVEMTQIKIFEIGHTFEKSGEKVHFAIGVKSPLGIKNKEKDAVVLANAIQEIEKKIGIKLNKINKEENIAEFDLGGVLAQLAEPMAYDFRFDFAEDEIRYRKISAYPYMTRDIAVFVPENEKAENVFKIVNDNAGPLLTKIRLFDVFTKKFEDGVSKTSYAYRLVFQSNEKTLSDIEVNAIMDKITQELNSKDGYKVR